MLFESLAPSIVARGLAQAREQNLRNRDAQYELLWDFYQGGYEIASKILRKPDEEDDELARRRQLAEYPNYVRRIADELLRNTYGFDVQRRLKAPADEGDNLLLADVLEASGLDLQQRKYAQSMFVLGDGWVNVAWQQAARQLKIFSVYPGNIWFATDPNNPGRIIELLEERPDPRSHGRKSWSTSLYWVWNLNEFTLVNNNGVPVPNEDGELGPWPNPYGCIPYVHFAARPSIGEEYGLSYLRDIVTIQNVILNRLSDLDVLVETQVAGQLVLSGVDISRISVGPRRAISTGHQGDAKFINPGADIAALMATIDWSKKSMFEISSIPMSVVEGGTASSGLALAIEMRPMTSVVEEARETSEFWEKELVRTVCAVASAHGIPLPTGSDCKPEIVWATNILPSDKDAEFRRDFSMVTAMPPLMTREDFVRKWHDHDGAALDDYMRRLDEDAASAYGASGPDASGGAGSDGASGGDSGGLNVLGTLQDPGRKTELYTQAPGSLPGGGNGP